MKTAANKTRWRIAVAGAVAVAAVAAGGAIAIAGSGEDTEHGPARAQAPANSVDPRLQEAFGLFRTDRLLVSDKQTAEAGPAAFGQNKALARAVPVPGGGNVFIVPGNDAVCLGDGVNEGHACVPVNDAVDGKLLLVTLADPRTPGTTVSGLVPDGVSEVSIALTSGDMLSVPVRDNVFDAVIEGTKPAVAGVAWKSASGQTYSQEFPGGVRRPAPPDGAALQSGRPSPPN
ncbi:hypothetical protein [Conexibacter arvalis]|uniref:Uncharacterized protein n=1 Tax=Conexibacter arvalis TaxID=912552 RepID=A0A840IF29_9ACTN|nr:hypothetical protein [Conexibacter arvalis]MBB4663452.1 hypothetical protein [Conexibacter arvalis]